MQCPHEGAALNEKIAELTEHMDSATGRLLKAIAEYERYEGWASDVSSCAHWLSYRCQVNMRTARERVRVARALERLPRTPCRPPVPADPMGALMEQNRAAGVQITPETNHVDWGGEPLDLVWIVDGILQDEREYGQGWRA